MNMKINMNMNMKINMNMKMKMNKNRFSHIEVQKLRRLTFTAHR